MSYWQAIDDELAAVSAEPSLQVVARRTTDESTFYEVRLTSIGPYRIFATLSVPNGPGLFPALLETPRYGSVNYLPHHNDSPPYSPNPRSTTSPTPTAPTKTPGTPG